MASSTRSVAGSARTLGAGVAGAACRIMPEGRYGSLPGISKLHRTKPGAGGGASGNGAATRWIAAAAWVRSNRRRWGADVLTYRPNASRSAGSLLAWMRRRAAARWRQAAGRAARSCWLKKPNAIEDRSALDIGWSLVTCSETRSGSLSRHAEHCCGLLRGITSATDRPMVAKRSASFESEHSQWWRRSQTIADRRR